MGGVIGAFSTITAVDSNNTKKIQNVRQNVRQNEIDSEIKSETKCVNFSMCDNTQCSRVHTEPATDDIINYFLEHHLLCDICSCSSQTDFLSYCENSRPITLCTGCGKNIREDHFMLCVDDKEYKMCNVFECVVRFIENKKGGTTILTEAEEKLECVREYTYEGRTIIILDRMLYNYFSENKLMYEMCNCQFSSNEDDYCENIFPTTQCSGCNQKISINHFNLFYELTAYKVCNVFGCVVKFTEGLKKYEEKKNKKKDNITSYGPMAY